MTGSAPFDHGAALLNAGDAVGAQSHFDQALASDPASPLLWFGKATALLVLEQREEAIKAFDRALALHPDLVEAHHNRASALHDLGQLDEAIEGYGAAIALRPDYIEAWQSLCMAYQETGDIPAAVQAGEQALRLDPANGLSSLNLSIALLSAGRLAEGWRHYARRYGPGMKAGRPLARLRPWWQGEPVPGKCLLVWREQGVGDELRWAGLVAEAARQADAARTILECDPRLISLLSRSLPAVLVRGESLSPDGGEGIDPPDADVQIPMASLGQILRPRLESFPPAEPFLRADPAQVSHWAQWLAHIGPAGAIGLAWRSGSLGGDRARFYPRPEELSPILALPGKHFVVMQHSAAPEEIAALEAQAPGRVHVPPGLDLRNDFEGLAGLLMGLSALVAPSTAIVDLAGGLGCHVHMLIRGPDWTLFGQKRSLWYRSTHQPLLPWNAPWPSVAVATAVALAAMEGTG